MTSSVPPATTILSTVGAGHASFNPHPRRRIHLCSPQPDSAPARPLLPSPDEHFEKTHRRKCSSPSPFHQESYSYRFSLARHPIYPDRSLSENRLQNIIKFPQCFFY